VLRWFGNVYEGAASVRRPKFDFACVLVFVFERLRPREEASAFMEVFRLDAVNMRKTKCQLVGYKKKE
jgi:hypothetical protein